MSTIDVIVLNNLGGGQSVQVDKLPLPGETVKGYKWKANIDAGKGPNSCIAMGRLGIHPAFIGKAGNDAAGSRGEKWMQESGVDTSGLLYSDDVMTGQGVRVVEKSGNNLIVCGESSSRALTVDEVIRELERLQPARFFSTGFEIREELTLEGARAAKRLGMTTILNFSPIPKENIGVLDYIDYLVINETEGAVLAGLASWKDIPIRKLLETVRDRFQCGCVIITLGGEGSVGLEGDTFWEISPIQINAVDTSGAGDAFLSAMIVNLVWGKDIQEACEWAGKFASYTTTLRGTIPSYPYLPDYEAYLKALK